MAKNKPTEKQIADAFALYWDSRTKRLKLEKEVKALKKAESEAAELLASAIPANESLHGVFHKTYEKPSVSYTKYAEYLITLIPKTKRSQATEAITEYTSKTSVHSFKASK